MNNPFHRAAVKAFADTLIWYGQLPNVLPREFDEVKELTREFERRLESQAKAFDACKRGNDISMSALVNEMSRALATYRKRLKLDGNFLAAESAFMAHMKPHIENRLW